MLKSILRVHATPLRHSFSTCHVQLAGHNKWSKIKDKKGTNDAQKSILYGNANRDIIVAARTGGSADPNANLQLATVLKKYKEQGVPRENLEKALSKASQGKEKGGGSVTYEALACGSVGVVIVCLTDNATRTIHNVRHVLTRHSAHLAPVKFMFNRKGCVKVSFDRWVENADKYVEGVIESALVAGADDFDQVFDDDIVILKFTCPPDALGKVTNAVMAHPPPSTRLQSSELIFAPLESISGSDELREQVSALVEELETDEDTLQVWTSLNLL